MDAKSLKRFLEKRYDDVPKAFYVESEIITKQLYVFEIASSMRC